MNGSPKRGPHVVKPLIVAMALAMTGSAYAASMGDVVTTRADQNIDQQYGRDSVYAFSIEAKPLKPEQQGASADAGMFGKVKSYAANAWDKTQHFAGAVWDKATGFLPHSSSSIAASHEYEVQPYGRAGGYVGPDRIAVLESPYALSANSQNVVKTGPAQANVADVHGRDMPAARSTPDTSPDSIKEEARIEGGRSSMPSQETALKQSGDVSTTDGSRHATVPDETTGMQAEDGLGYPQQSESGTQTQ